MEVFVHPTRSSVFLWSSPSRTWFLQGVFYGWLHQTYFPKHLLSYNFLPRESLTFILETHCTSLSSWIVTPFAKPVLAGSDRGLAHPRKSQKALSLSHNWHEVFTKWCLLTNNPFPLFTVHTTKKQSISITETGNNYELSENHLVSKSTRTEERRMLSPSKPWHFDQKCSYHMQYLPRGSDRQWEPVVETFVANLNKYREKTQLTP